MAAALHFSRWQGGATNGSENGIDDRYWKPAYRYGYDSAARHHGRRWDEVENDLRGGWDTYEHRGSARGTWEQVKDAVRDGWDRLVGNK